MLNSEVDMVLRTGHQIVKGDQTVDVLKWLSEAKGLLRTSEDELHPTKVRVLNDLVTQIERRTNQPSAA